MTIMIEGATPIEQTPPPTFETLLRTVEEMDPFAFGIGTTGL
ncbi:hypothetical protein [Streptomyces sp. NPDC054849]